MYKSPALKTYGSDLLLTPYKSDTPMYVFGSTGGSQKTIGPPPPPLQG
jgi:hypothetical protein